MKRLFLILTVLTICAGISLNSQTAIPPSEGDGTESNPYQIASLANLYWISEDIGNWDKSFIQTVDINASETIDWFDGNGWKPIGVPFYDEIPYSGPPFTGSYDGQDFVIDSLFISRSGDGIGLFGATEGSVIQNVGLTNVFFDGYLWNTGGIVGVHASNSLMNNCYVTGQITGKSIIGGIIGHNSDSTVNSCYSEVEVIGESDLGGLIGHNELASVVQSYSESLVRGSMGIGGLVGRSTFSSIIDSYSTSNVEVQGYGSSIGGLIGYNDASIVNNSYYDYEAVLLNGEHVITIGALDNETFTAWLGNNLSLDIADYFSFDGEDYLIGSEQDFWKLLLFGQFPANSFKLTSNLDLSGRDNIFIPYFTGIFLGNGHTIINFNADFSETNYSSIGLFGSTYEAEVRNLNLTGFSVKGKGDIGGLTGSSYDSSFHNIQLSGIVEGSFNAGGLAGSGKLIHIKDCESNVSISGIGKAGGLAGVTYFSEIENSYSIGSVSGSNWIGGLAGMIDGQTIVHNCISKGVVQGSSAVGGLIGESGLSSVVRSFSEGNVEGDDTVGGLIGYLSESYVSDSYSTGDVDATSYAGGLVGFVFYSDIANCYSLGNVTGDSASGGLIGYNYDFLDSVISNSYWNTETSAQSYSEGGEGRTTEEMTYPYAANTYAGWNFSEIWQADPGYDCNSGYPFLTEMPLSTEEEEEGNIVDVTKTAVYLYPNPFNPETTIFLALAEKDINRPVTVTVYNIKGQRVAVILEDEIVRENELKLAWRGSNDQGKELSSGIYFVRIETNSNTISRKITLLK